MKHRKMSILLVVLAIAFALIVSQRRSARDTEELEGRVDITSSELIGLMAKRAQHAPGTVCIEDDIPVTVVAELPWDAPTGTIVYQWPDHELWLAQGDNKWYRMAKSTYTVKEGPCLTATSEQ